MFGLSPARRLTFLAIVPAVLLVLLAACGGGGGQATSPPEAPATTASQPGASPTSPPATTPIPTPAPEVTPLPGATSPPPPVATPTPVPPSEAEFSASTTEGEAPLNVAFTNLSKNADVFEWDFGDETTATSTSVGETLTHEYTEAGIYQVTLRALKEGQADAASTSTVSVTVEPGPLFEVKIEPGALTASPVEEQLFTVIALDQFGNEIPGLSYVFEADEQAGEVDDTGNFTAGTVAGSYSGAVTVEAVQGAVTKTVTVDITIEHGALDRVLLTPEVAELGIGEDQKFTAVAIDAYENPVSEAQIDWAIDEAVGTIAEDGTLSVGTLAGTFEQGVQATASFSGATAEATASVTVNPGPPVALSLAPTEVAAGATQQLQASVADEFGNAIDGVEVAWSVTNENAGSISSSGLLTAGEVVGEFDGAVEANATTSGLTTSNSVNITPGALAQVVIAPDPVSIGIEMNQQFVAVGADQFGNRISGLDFTWSVEQGGGRFGAITEGLFIAGSSPGTYNKTVTVTAVQGTIEASDAASVSVEADRIAFLSDRIGDTGDIYVMDDEGGNVQRVTGSEIGFQRPSWSPDGRRIVHGSNNTLYVGFGNIQTVNDDGTWGSTVLSESFTAFEPAWSPDGTKIAYQSWEHGTDDDFNSEIYVMDLDGGNTTRLTNNSDYDDFPRWSPDGSEIAFVRTVGDFDHIFVMDADGTNERRLTFGSDFNSNPIWSPDGTQIAFQSAAAGENWAVTTINPTGVNEIQLTTTAQGGAIPSWSPDSQRIVFHSSRDSDDPLDPNGVEVYVMDRNGGNVARLTNNAAFDGVATWGPRKRGVEVTEASVVIPDASSMRPLTAQEVNKKVGPAVVRITTDEGVAGSGFIFDSNGLILTNNHVISGAETITVFLEDGTTFVGTVQGRDLVRDLAVLKIEGSGFPTVELGDVSQAPSGTDLLAIGFPLGLTGITTTSGEVSGIKYDPGSNITYVQTSTPINPGNSGGPLLNLQGQVVGVVTSTFSISFVEEFGLAVAVNTVKLYLDRMIDGEVITS